MGPRIFAIAGLLFCIITTSAFADIEYVLQWSRPSSSPTGIECRFQEWISDATGRRLNGWIYFDRKGIGHFTPNPRISHSVPSPRAERPGDGSNVVDLVFSRTSLKKMYGSLLRSREESELVSINFPNNPKGYVPTVESVMLPEVSGQMPEDRVLLPEENGSEEIVTPSIH